MGYGLSRYPLNTGDVQFVGDVTVRITSPPWGSKKSCVYEI